MITKVEAIDLAKQFIKEELPSKSWFNHIKPHLKTILLYGSVAKRTNRENSDIDILMITPLAIEEEYTAGEYFYVYKSQTINIVLRSIERLRNIARAHDDALQKEVFRECEILFATDNEVKDLLNKIATI